MSKILGIIGAGHLGLQIANLAISDGHYNKIVFFDDVVKENQVEDFQILGSSDVVLDHFNKNSFDELLIGIGYNHLNIRQALFERFSGKVPFATIIHSSNYVDPTATIAEGVIVYPCCCIDANAIIASNSVINLSCTISHDSIIGAHSFLAPRVAVAGFVTTAERCFFGINTTISDSVSIVAETQTGAGSVVIKDILVSGVYVGNPIKKIR